MEDQYLSLNNLPTNTTIYKENIDLKISKIIEKNLTKLIVFKEGIIENSLYNLLKY